MIDYTHQQTSKHPHYVCISHKHSAAVSCRQTGKQTDKQTDKHITVKSFRQTDFNVLLSVYLTWGVILSLDLVLMCVLDRACHWTPRCYTRFHSISLFYFDIGVDEDLQAFFWPSSICLCVCKRERDGPVFIRYQNTSRYLGITNYRRSVDGQAVYRTHQKTFLTFAEVTLWPLTCKVPSHLW